MHTEKTVALSATARAVAARVGSLRDFLEFLGEQGQCVHWPDPVLPEPDIRNISVAAGNDAATGPAVVFDKIRGYPGKRIAINVHGSFGNLALLLGYPKTTPIRDLFHEIIRRWGSDKPLLERIAPEKAPVNENRLEKNINLYSLLPLYRINACDGGFYIAKACVVSRDPLEPDNFGKQNVGIYRIQVMGPDTFTLLSIPAHDMGRQMLMAEQHNKPLKVSIMIGNHPAMAMFAATPVGYDESEFAYASQMMGAPLRLTTAVNGTDILADSEMVIEGELLPNQREVEGPFGEFPGSYSGVRKVPLFRVTGVSHRNDPIFENIYIGKGWTEHDTLIGLNTSAPIYAQLKKDFPEVVAVNALYQHGLTGIIAVLDPDDGTVQYASAGHPPLLLGGLTGITQLGPTGPLLGPIDATWETRELSLTRGGVLVAFSDGLIEARDVEGEPFGVKRIAAIVERTQLGGPDAVADACLDAVQAHQLTREDDLTLVVLAR